MTNNNSKYIKTKNGKFAGSLPSPTSVPSAKIAEGKIPTSVKRVDGQTPKEISVAYAKYILSLEGKELEEGIEAVDNPFTLHEIAKQTEESEIKAQVAQNQNTKAFTLMYLVNRESADSIRAAIINNPNCDEKVVTKWLKNASRSEVAEVLSSGHPNYLKVSGLALDKIEKGHLVRSSDINDEYETRVVSAIASHPNAGINTLRNITRRFPIKYGEELIKNPNLPDDARNSVIRTNRWEHRKDI